MCYYIGEDEYRYNVSGVSVETNVLHICLKPFKGYFLWPRSNWRYIHF